VTVPTLETPTEQRLRLAVAFATDDGGRSGNEDAVFVEEIAPLGVGEGSAEAGFLIAIADGMGGYQRGEVASQMAIDIVKEMYEADPGADAALLLKQAFRRANDRIYENGQGATPAAMMGTTLLVAATRGKYATIANIGDSRAYLARANRLTQVTKDHSFVAEQVAQGAMTESEARESPHRNILTHALGHRPKLDSKMPNIFELTLLPEDRLLLCTDGFYDVVPDNDLLNVLLTLDPEPAAQRLVQLANERGTTDNVTAVVVSALPAREKPVILIASGPSRLVPAIGLAAAAILILIIAILYIYLT
jgi:serine/threonine protein phosphatase PrpC